MKNIDHVFKSIEFIERNLQQPIKIEDISNEVGFSIYHFSRIFNKYTGHSPYDYMIRRRISEVAKEIVLKKEKIIDIAFDYHFNNYETFLRAFKRMFGILPNDLRKAKNIETLILRLPITYDYLLHINRKDFFTASIIELEDINFIGKILNYIKCNIITEKEWVKFLEDIKILENRITPEEFYRISFFSMNPNIKTTEMLTVKVATLDRIPYIFVAKKVDRSKCLKFTYKGPLADIEMTYNYIFQTWLPKSKYKMKECFTVEKYDVKSIGKDKIIEGIDILIPVE